MSNSTVGDAAIAVVRRNTEEVQGKGNWDLSEELFALRGRDAARPAAAARCRPSAGATAMTVWTVTVLSGTTEPGSVK
jgi:hypothetical protein